MNLFGMKPLDCSKIVKTNDTKETDNPTPAQGEWIWVEGYKGFHHDLTCRDMQYEIGKTYKYEGEVIMCKQGYHFCRDLADVLTYYCRFVDEDRRSRICKVRGLVRKSDFERYGTYEPSLYMPAVRIDKLVAKELVIVSELSLEEIATTVYPDHSVDFAVLVLKYGAKTAEVIQLGFKPKTANWIIRHELTELAEVLAENRNHYTEKEILNILIEKGSK